LARTVGERRQDRPHAHDRQPDGEGALAAEPVTERTHRQEQARKHQDVGVDHPLQLGGAGIEVALQRWQGDIDDRVVHHDQQQAQAHHSEDEPAAAADLARLTMTERRNDPKTKLAHGSWVTSSSAPEVKPLSGTRLQVRLKPDV
jgi:hypothetical protein